MELEEVWADDEEGPWVASLEHPNLLAGWAGLVLAVLLLHWTDYAQDALPTFAACSIGVLLIGLFHAGPGAFGRRETADIDEQSTTGLHN